jgi:heptosyltransferase-2
VAVELSPHYPNAVSLFWRAGIPCRVGYATGGDGPLLTHVVPWVEGRHMGEDHVALLPPVIGAARADAGLDGYRLAPMSADATARARDARTRFGINAPYVVIHAGSGSAKRVWPAAHWRTVAHALSADGVQVVLSGFGGDEAALNREIAGGVDGVADLTDRVNWDESRGILANAAAILCANTVAMHLAGAHNVPAVVVMDGTEPAGRWRPPGPHVRVLSQPVPCSPCYLSRGCAAMTCLRGVMPDQVLAAVRSIFKTSGAAAVPARL